MKYLMKANDDCMINVELLISNLKNFKSGITSYLTPHNTPEGDIASKLFVPHCIYPDYIMGGTYVLTSDALVVQLEFLEQYPGPILDIDNVFLNGILTEKSGVKRHGSQLFAHKCQTRNNSCLMFNAIVFYVCEKSEHIIKFWYKWKNTSRETCI
jgi:hypothetical protein